MRRRILHLDSLFEVALVLLGILSAAEFQYFLVIAEKNEYPYVLRVFTVPFIVLILAWLAKEIFSDILSKGFRRLLTEFCWDFWSFTLFYYLLHLVGGFQTGILLSLALSILLIASLVWAYRRASPVDCGDRSMQEYYESIRWRSIRLLGIFVGAYCLLVLIVLP